MARASASIFSREIAHVVDLLFPDGIAVAMADMTDATATVTTPVAVAASTAAPRDVRGGRTPASAASAGA